MLTIGKHLRSLIVAAIWLGLWCSSAHAHGGIAGPDELGPPVITAAVLGIGGYWTVVLWPSRKNTGPRSKAPRRPHTRLGGKSNTRY